MVPVQFAAPLGLSDMDPVGRLVAGAGEALGVDEGFQQGAPLAPWCSFRSGSREPWAEHPEAVKVLVLRDEQTIALAGELPDCSVR